ncbi:MAG: helix-turn-helix transcriptional regulator, partial [Micromonosporaceae bacterium]|nr:helix-turn-helix transcriptional regulator [Micromonosporaceae bacterium]
GDPAGGLALLQRAAAGGTAADPVLAVGLARHHLGVRDPAGALGTLPPAVGLPIRLRLEAGLVRTVATAATGDRPAADRTLEEVLDIAEPEGYRRLFRLGGPELRDLLVRHLDTGTAHWSFVRELLTAGGEPDPTAAEPAGAQPLTEREMTILRYLQSILSNVEIAAELSVSVNTVKTHVRNIYRKLGTTKRRDAVREARERRLL